LMVIVDAGQRHEAEQQLKLYEAGQPFRLP
jgi:hypothetical protein